MAGVDRQFGENVFGVSLNLMRYESTLNESVGSLDIDGYALSLYGSRGGLLGSGAPSAGAGTHFDGVHVKGSLTVGRNRYKAEHVVDITGMPLSAPRATTTRTSSRSPASPASKRTAAAVNSTSPSRHLVPRARRRPHRGRQRAADLFVAGTDVDSLTTTAAFSAKGPRGRWRSGRCCRRSARR